MKQTIDKSLFIQAFENYDRVNNFGYAGLHALYNYLEGCEADDEAEIELDVIALCCDYSQYDTVQDALDAYSNDTLEELEEHTVVIQYHDHETGLDSCIIQGF